MPAGSTTAIKVRTDAGAAGEIDQQAVFHALDEPVCRAILTAVQAEARTARELADECGQSLSTVYRKISLLTDAGLIEEHTRIKTRGKHASQYICAFDEIAVSVTADGVLLRVSR